jgi:hypothetical protein
MRRRQSAEGEINPLQSFGSGKMPPGLLPNYNLRVERQWMDMQAVAIAGRCV